MNNNISNITNLSSNIAFNILYKYSLKNDSIKNLTNSYMFRSNLFDMNFENKNNKFLKTKNLERELNESNSSTEAPINP